jgi:hypothetical protein
LRLKSCKTTKSNIINYSLQPIEALTVAKTYGMQYPKDMANDAALYGRLQLLQWLHEHRCPWDESAVLKHAATGGSVDGLVWLQSVTAPWSYPVKVALLDIATVHSRGGVKWLTEITSAPTPRERAALAAVRRAILA